MKKAIDFFTAHPARFFLLAALLWGGFMCLLNCKDGSNFSWHDLLVEANGMVFDLLVFGILLSIYERLRERERLHEEIDDYRGWDEKEATFKIVGSVKRLNKLGVSNTDLSGCFLQNANLMWTDLQEASLKWADLRGTNLMFTNLQEADLIGGNLQGACLHFANLRGTNLRGANLQEADLRQAIVGQNWFEKLEEWEVEGREEIKAKYFIDKEGNLQERQ